jgi:hypothetical protein
MEWKPTGGQDMRFPCIKNTFLYNTILALVASKEADAIEQTGMHFSKQVSMNKCLLTFPPKGRIYPACSSFI